jgi:hypothetical protein
MYALYEKLSERLGHRYRFKEQVSLFGCNSGWIPRLLKGRLSPNASEPLAWHIDLGQELRAHGYPDHALIINLKPNSTEPNLSLYEISEVWGYSSSGWTPLMFYLKGIFVDEVPDEVINDQDFFRRDSEVDDPIFSMMYVRGTVRAGGLYDRWTAPRPSPTNSVLLWPDTLQYFVKEAQKISGRTEPEGAEDAPMDT